MLLASNARHLSGSCLACALQVPQGLFKRVLPGHCVPSVVIAGTLPSQVQDYASVIVEFPETPVHLACQGLSGLQPCPQASEPLCHICHPLQVVDKDVKLDWSSHRGGTSLSTVLWAEYDLVTTTLWAWQPSSFLPARLCTYPDDSILNWMQKYCIHPPHCAKGQLLLPV